MKKPKEKLKLIHSKKNGSNIKIKKLEKELKTIIEKIEKNLNKNKHKNENTKLPNQQRN